MEGIRLVFYVIYTASFDYLFILAWESAWVSQRLDAQSAVNLARSGAGKNRKLLRTPPLPPQCQQLNITHPLSELANKYPDHTCLAIYIQQYNEKLQVSVFIKLI